MAPDAEKLRKRTGSAVGSTTDGNNDAATMNSRLSTVKGLGPNEVAIDGVIYDISNFDHPGGESIRIFGGNDVTVNYKMIHPYHTNKHLEKMTQVGKLTDYVPE
jgi:fatty acid desaturase (delta-4 desaturase)